MSPFLNRSRSNSMSSSSQYFKSSKESRSRETFGIRSTGVAVDGASHRRLVPYLDSTRHSPIATLGYSAFRFTKVDARDEGNKAAVAQRDLSSERSDFVNPLHTVSDSGKDTPLLSYVWNGDLEFLQKIGRDSLLPGRASEMLLRLFPYRALSHEIPKPLREHLRPGTDDVKLRRSEPEAVGKPLSYC